MKRGEVAAIGECMVELSPRPGWLYGLGFGGDTLNTAVYLARLGVAVDYLTALGDDPFSDDMLTAWASEGVGTAAVRRRPGRLPGLYLIQTDSGGERRFHYWREQAPARELFAGPDVPDLSGYRWIYLSGISLSLYGPEGRERLHGAVDNARAAGARVAFDLNYRPRGWPSAQAAAAAMDALLGRCDLALPSLDDARALYGDGSAGDLLRRFRALGASEVVLKQGPAPALLAWGEEMAEIPAAPVAATVDTTAAGDSFNAGYLAARLAGQAPANAASAGHRLAAAVIGHPGAIIPRAAMPAWP